VLVFFVDLDKSKREQEAFLEQEEAAKRELAGKKIGDENVIGSEGVEKERSKQDFV